ncbi:unnamed protein product [Schistosoma bovis]|nr:unnamed protein product [Schistosoma bovis]
MGNSNSSNNDQNNWMTVTPNDASMPMFELSLRSVVERRPIFPSKISFNNGQSSNFYASSSDSTVTAGDKSSVGNSSCLPNTHQPTNFSSIQQPANFLNNSVAQIRNNPSHNSPQISTERQFVVLHDYVKRVDDDLNMTKGQIFNILDNSDCDWWYAGCVSTDSRGYVPKNHLAAVTSLYSNERYFGGLKRIEAEHYLQLPGNDHGSFLVRISESQSSEYSLSVREENTVKHDRIRSRYSRTDRTLKRLYISRQLPYVNIQQLVNHYFENQSGLCCRLGRPCI